MAEAVAIKGEEIIAVGSTKKIKAYINEIITKTIDANGRLVLPGFNDAHVHFRPLDPDYVELRYVNDPGVITQRVKVQVDKSKPGELVRGGHWDHELFSTREWPSKELLDVVSPRNPVILSRVDGHSVLVNSYVLKASGITENTPDPFGGEIQKDPVTKKPTGILKETAMDLIKTGAVETVKNSQEIGKSRRGYLRAKARELGVTNPGAGQRRFEMCKLRMMVC